MYKTCKFQDDVNDDIRYEDNLNPLPPSDAVRQQKKIFLRIFSVQYRLNLKNITPLKTLNFII